MHVFKQVSITVACLPNGFLNNFQSVLVFPIVLSYNMWKTFNANPEVSKSSACIKVISAQCCVLRLTKAGRRPCLVSRLPNILHETNLCLLSGQILSPWFAKHPQYLPISHLWKTKCFAIGNIYILSCGTLTFYVFFIGRTFVWWGYFSGIRSLHIRRLNFHNLVIKARLNRWLCQASI